MKQTLASFFQMYHVFMPHFPEMPALIQEDVELPGQSEVYGRLRVWELHMAIYKVFYFCHLFSTFSCLFSHFLLFLKCWLQLLHVFLNHYRSLFDERPFLKFDSICRLSNEVSCALPTSNFALNFLSLS